MIFHREQLFRVAVIQDTAFHCSESSARSRPSSYISYMANNTRRISLLIAAAVVILMGILMRIYEYPLERACTPLPAFTILYAGSTWNYLDPCGCCSHKVVRLPRRLTAIKKSRNNYTPVLMVDSGSQVDYYLSSQTQELERRKIPMMHELKVTASCSQVAAPPSLIEGWVTNASCNSIPPPSGNLSFEAIDFNTPDPEGKNNYQRLFQYLTNQNGFFDTASFDKSYTIHSTTVSSNRNDVISIVISEFTPLTSSMEASPFPLIGSVIEMLVTDPLKRRTGYDYSIRGKVRETPDPRLLQEIPNSIYHDGNVIDESRILHIHEPLAGDYTIKIIGTQKCRYGGRIWVTDQNDNSAVIDIKGGIISPGEIQSFKVSYDSSNANNCILKKVVNSGQIASSLQTAFDLNWIDNKEILNSLTQKIERAESAVAKGHIDTAIANLKAFINEVRAQKGKHIKNEAADILIDDARSYIKMYNF